MKKIFIATLIVALAIIPIFSGCTESSSTTSPTTAAATTAATTSTAASATAAATTPAAATTTASTEVIELRFTSQYTEMGPQVTLIDEWANEISEATNGKVKITVYPGSVLMAEQDIISGVKAGLADIGEASPAIAADQFPLTSILCMPLMPLGSLGNAYNIWVDLEAEFPALGAEFEDFKVLAFTTSGGSSIHTAKTQVRLPEDMDGVKIMTFGTMMELVEAAGGSPVFLPIEDLYTSFDRGMLDGMWASVGAIYDMQLYPFMPYHTQFASSLGAQLGVGKTIMNLDTWNSLPSDVQQVFEDFNPWMSEKRWQLEQDNVSAAIAAMQSEGGQTFVTLTTEEEQMWYEVASPLHRTYLATYDAQGLPATEIYEKALELAEGYSE